MKKLALILCLAMAVAVGGCKDENIPPVPDPVPSPSPDPEPTPSPSPEPSPEPSPSPSPEPEPTPEPTPEPPLDVDALFSASDSTRAKVREYVKKFVEDGLKQNFDTVPLFKNGPKLKIQIASLDYLGSSVVGLCAYSSSHRTVTLDPDFFNTSNSQARNEVLVHHELGHCILDRRHRTAKGYIPPDSTYHELSIMYPSMLSKSTYTFHYEWYQSELYGEAAHVPGQPDYPEVHICGPEDEQGEISEE